VKQTKTWANRNKMLFSPSAIFTFWNIQAAKNYTSAVMQLALSTTLLTTVRTKTVQCKSFFLRQIRKNSSVTYSGLAKHTITVDRSAFQTFTRSRYNVLKWQKCMLKCKDVDKSTSIGKRPAWKTVFFSAQATVFDPIIRSIRTGTSWSQTACEFVVT